MVAPEVDEARETISAPLCAALVVMVGAVTWTCTGLIGVELPLPPQPHRIKKMTIEQPGTAKALRIELPHFAADGMD
jgi:hypothetical protein